MLKNAKKTNKIENFFKEKCKNIIITTSNPNLNYVDFSIFTDSPRNM